MLMHMHGHMHTHMQRYANAIRMRACEPQVAVVRRWRFKLSAYGPVSRLLTTQARGLLPNHVYDTRLLALATLHVSWSPAAVVPGG